MQEQKQGLPFIFKKGCFSHYTKSDLRQKILIFDLTADFFFIPIFTIFKN